MSAKRVCWIKQIIWWFNTFISYFWFCSKKFVRYAVWYVEKVFTSILGYFCHKKHPSLGFISLVEHIIHFNQMQFQNTISLTNLQLTKRRFPELSWLNYWTKVLLPLWMKKRTYPYLLLLYLFLKKKKKENLIQVNILPLRRNIYSLTDFIVISIFLNSQTKRFRYTIPNLALNTCFGTYTFLRLPMGLSTSPIVFRYSWTNFWVAWQTSLFCVT